MDRSTPQAFEIGRLTPELLVEFLDSLRLAGYKVGLAQYIAAQDLLVAIAARGDKVQTQTGRSHSEQLQNMLGPIVCSNPSEQVDFQRRFQTWLQMIEAVAVPAAPAESLEQTLEKVEKRDRRLRRILIYITLALISFLSPVLINQWLPSFFDSPRLDPEVAPSPRQRGNPFDISGLLEVFTTGLQSFESFEETWIGWKLALALVIVLPILAFGVWWFWWRRKVRQFLQRRPSTEPPELEKISIPDSDQSLFPPALFGQIAQQLRRRIPVPCKEIDVEKTLQASLQQGGWLTPVYGIRKVLPEYLFLIDRSSYRDHQSRFVEEAIARLQQNGVFVTCYTFNGDPRICTPHRGKASPQRLAELAAQYRHHRLLVFVESGQLFRSDTGKMAPWTEQLTQWRDRVVLTPKAIDHWSYQEEELAEQFVVLPATVQGLQNLIQSLHKGKNILSPEETDRAPLPEALRIHPRLWIQRDPPPSEQIYEVLPQLKDYLGKSGFQWLCACAVFPKLHWNLTVFLGNVLQTAKGSSLLEASSMTDLARLPWFRHGYMPDWLRQYLISLLTPEQEQLIRQNLQGLLLTAVHGKEPGGFQLDIVNHNPNLVARLAKPVMKRLVKETAAENELKDYIFIDFILERHRQSLAVEMPPEMREILKPRATITGGRFTWTILLVSTVLGGLIGLLIQLVWPNDHYFQTNLLSAFLLVFSLGSIWLLIRNNLTKKWDWAFLTLFLLISGVNYYIGEEISLTNIKDYLYIGIILVSAFLFLNSVHLRLEKLNNSEPLKLT